MQLIQVEKCNQRIHVESDEERQTGVVSHRLSLSAVAHIRPDPDSRNAFGVLTRTLVCLRTLDICSHDKYLNLIRTRYKDRVNQENWFPEGRKKLSRASSLKSLMIIATEFRHLFLMFFPYGL